MEELIQLVFTHVKFMNVWALIFRRRSLWERLEC